MNKAEEELTLALVKTALLYQDLYSKECDRHYNTKCSAEDELHECKQAAVKLVSKKVDEAGLTGVLVGVILGLPIWIMVYYLVLFFIGA